MDNEETLKKVYISQKEVIDLLAKLKTYCNKDKVNGATFYLNQAIININKLQQKELTDNGPRLIAKWEINCDGYYPYCTNCKNEPQGREMTDYCPNCGAYMREF